MSTNRSVGRSTAAHNTARSAATHESGRPARKSKKDRSPNLCTFTFADGRQCRTPRCSGHLHYCYFHAQKEAQSLAAQQVGQDISRFLPTKLLTACDLGAAMSRLFCAVAQGQIKPKVASTLAYLAQTMLQSIPIGQHEYIESFDTDTWRNAVRASFRYEDEANTPAPQPAAPQPPAPAPAQPTPVEPGRNSSRPGREPGPSASSSSTSSPAPQPSAQPAPSPRTPLPPTSTEFAQQLLAGRNSSRSETPTPAGSEIPTSPVPAREPVSSVTSSSTSPIAPQSPVNCHSERSEEPASFSNSSPACPPRRATHHSPLPQPPQPPPSSPAPPPSPSNSQPAPVPPARTPVPPSFGAPANWDALIPPKPRRRFSRHGHLLD
jgi:hypothetical protein